METKEQEILIDQIDIPEILMRDDGDEEGVPELAQDIKDNGLINAINLRPKAERYELVAGRRRIKAFLYLGRDRIRAIIRELTDEQALMIMASENLARKDLDPVDEAVFAAKLLKTGLFQVVDIARIVKQSVNWVQDRLAILDYPEYLIAFLKEGKIKIGVAKYLGAIEDDVYRRMYVEQAVNYGTTVLQAEYLFRQWEMGLLAPSGTIIPPSNEELGASKPIMKAICRKCGKLAVAPNIESVFIHVECPAGIIKAP